MKLEWDYTKLADAYLKRPDYAQEAIDTMVEKMGVSSNVRACDIGAGAAHLTIKLAEKGFSVSAIEPNDAMRANGIKRTAQFPKVEWHVGIADDTGMESGVYDIVTFGSSFGVSDRQIALKESHRLLKQNGYFACMWNHRDLTDPLQEQIENIIKSHVSDYSYGTRREDQTAEIDKSGLFDTVQYIEANVIHSVNAKDFAEGWRSHATVHRQSGEKFEAIMNEINSAVMAMADGNGNVKVPYTTRVYMAKKK